MEYDKIVEGRRRNWDGLKPEEELRREKEEERAKKKADWEERIKKGEAPASYGKGRELKHREAQELDLRNYRHVKKQSIILLGGFVLLFLLVFGVERFFAWRTHKNYQEALDKYEIALVAGEEVVDRSSPVAALATWRSAWARGDTNTVVDLYSTRYLRRKSAKGKPDQLKREYATLFRKGSLSSMQELALRFKGASVLMIPRSPYTHGELAVFLSEPIRRTKEKKAIVYSAAFAYDRRSKDWKLADIRPEDFFSVAWEIERDIQRMVGGATAVRYDKKGRVAQSESNDDELDD